MNSWGNNIRLTLFGESHGPAIGITIDGIPAGITLDMDLISNELSRRRPKAQEWSTTRNEADAPEIISGVLEGKTTGGPICCVIYNKDQRSSDYSDLLRPGHADWTAFIKHKGSADMRGGGRFSGRLTAPLVFAGAIAKQILAERGIAIYGRIKAIGREQDDIDLTQICIERNMQEEALIETISRKDFPASDEKEDIFKEYIAKAKADKDSIGGIIEAVCVGVPGGLGEPFFESVESRLSAMLFSVPAVKGVEFGRGFDIATMKGSEANDSIGIKDGSIYSRTNNNGGLLGGITNGMPIVFRVAIKPTASIGIEQDTVDPIKMKETKISINGRHDPCIVPRAVPVIEACAALALLDIIWGDQNE